MDENAAPGDWKLPWDAGCRCARVRMRVTAAPLLAFACHCTGCQRMTASAFSLTLAIPAAGFEVVHGETVLGGLQGPHRHFYCAFCKSWLFTRPAGLDAFVNLRATMLDEPRWVVPYVDTAVDEGFAWATTGAVHRFGGMPDDAAFGPLVAEFATRGARPR